MPATRSRHPQGARRSSSATWSTAGPTIAEVLRLVMAHGRRRAPRSCVPGNHDMKLMRKLDGRDVQITHGLAESLAQLEARAAGVPRAGRASSSTAWSATTCSTTASWSSPTPG